MPYKRLEQCLAWTTPVGERGPESLDGEGTPQATPRPLSENGGASGEHQQERGSQGFSAILQDGSVHRGDRCPFHTVAGSSLCYRKGIHDVDQRC